MRLTSAAFDRAFGSAWHVGHSLIRRLLGVDSIGAAPAFAPNEIGQQVDDTINTDLYEAKGLTSSDWQKICRRIEFHSITYDPASVAAATATENATTMTVPGAAVGDRVIVQKPTNTAGVVVAGARVSGANTVTVAFCNPTAGAVDPGSEVYLVTLFKK